MSEKLTQITLKEALQFAIKLCSRKEKCKFDIEQKLKQCHLPESTISEIIKILEKERYIDEFRYARSFTNDKLKLNKWGKIKIEIALKQKKIPDVAIQHALQEVDKDEYREILKYELLKKRRSLNKLTDTYAIKQKLFQFGMQRGFESDLISQISAEIIDKN